MNTLLFLGFSFHKKTKSYVFLINLLKKQYDIQICWIDLYEKDPYRALIDYKGEYDSLVCFQILPPEHLIKRHFRFKHKTLFPMADGCPSIKKPDKWYQYRDYQIISFSRQLYEQLAKAGFSAHYFQYFPAPSEVQELGDEASAFFWARRIEISSETISKLTESSFLNHIHVHNVPDPGMEPFSTIELSKVEYTFSTWLEDKSELNKLILQSACYIAPRKKEGIGMSFLEAMALGRCVIAPNQTTMNEYIQHGVNGLLYDHTKPSTLGKVDVRMMQKNAIDSIRKGHQQWNDSIEQLLHCIRQTPQTRSKTLYMHMGMRFLRNPIKATKALIG